MDRRTFLASSVAAAGLSTMAGEAGGQSTAGGGEAAREIYELRHYHLRGGPMLARMHEYLQNVSIPAHNRAGARKVGAFTPQFGPDSPSIFLLVVYPSLQEFGALAGRLDADQEYKKAAEEHAALPPSDPAYVRIDSRLSQAAPFMPKLEVPAAAEGNKPRIFELRTYESHSKRASRKKQEMFGAGGELAIFRRTGLTPVFFSDNLIGDRLPSLTYMLVFDDMAARETNWGKFVGDPEWKALSSKPGYTDAEIVSNITSVILRPTAYSQV
jgi:hypothetical protein